MMGSLIAQNSTDQDAVLMKLLADQSRHPHLGQIAIALRDTPLSIYGDRTDPLPSLPSVQISL